MSSSNTLFVGKVARRYDRLDSTNAEALRLLSEPPRPAAGTALLAAEQTAGRGQTGRSWHATPGQNLTLSVILYPTFLAATEQFRLNRAVSLAIAATVGDWVPDDRRVRIKWPNDIYIGDRKVCGILIQNGIQGRHLGYSVVGIGLNVNEPAFPPELPNPTSLAREAGRPLSLEEVTRRLFVRLEQEYLGLRRGADQRAYGQLLYRLGVPSYFRRADGSRFRGTIVQVDAAGHLIIDSARGREVFGWREVSYELAV